MKILHKVVRVVRPRVELRRVHCNVCTLACANWHVLDNWPSALAVVTRVQANQ